MIVVDITADSQPTREQPNSPFPPHISDDEWILYHGTSSIYEQEIDRLGLRPGSELFKRADIQQIVDIFDRLQWHGRSTASRAVLEPWSLEHAYRDNRGKPIFFAESVHRAMTFAARDFAGGETAYAIRHSFADFDAYLSDKNIRDDHQAELEAFRAIQWPAQRNDLGEEPPLALAELAAQIDSLRHIRERAMECLTKHSYGLIYAVQMKRDYIPHLEKDMAMGIMSFKEISVDLLAGKARVHFDAGPQVDAPLPWEVPAAQGILAALED